MRHNKTGQDCIEYTFAYENNCSTSISVQFNSNYFIVVTMKLHYIEKTCRYTGQTQQKSKVCYIAYLPVLFM